MSKRDDLRTTLDELMEDLPINRFVRLRRTPMKCFGSCSLSVSEKTITITISTNYPTSTQIDTLIHEYAHALEFDQTGNHSPVWGKFHAQSYTAWAKRHA